MKTLRLVALSALASFGMASAAAAEMTATTGLNMMSIDAAGANMDTSELSFELDGRFDNGLRFDADIGYTNVDDLGIGMRSAEIGLAWHYRDVAGPALRYVASEFAGTSTDMLMLGVSGEYAFGSLSLEGELVSDVEDFGDTVMANIGADYDLGNRIVLTADIDHLNVKGSPDTTLLNLGAEYALTEAAFIKGGVSVGEVLGENAKGVNLGIGFRF